MNQVLLPNSYIIYGLPLPISGINIVWKKPTLNVAAFIGDLLFQ